MPDFKYLQIITTVNEMELLAIRRPDLERENHFHFYLFDCRNGAIIYIRKEQLVMVVENTEQVDVAEGA
jgi:membrane protease subunit (stomatin/prohibitin family)